VGHSGRRLSSGGDAQEEINANLMEWVESQRSVLVPVRVNCYKIARLIAS
jgi:hypothetical protein